MKIAKVLLTITVAAGLNSVFSADSLLSGKIENVNFFSPARYVFQHGLKVQTQDCNYTFFAARSKSDGKRPESNSFILTSGNPVKYGFCTASNFLTVTVNGIPSGKIMMKPEYFTAYDGKDFKGCSLKLNFDGCIVYLKTFMKQDSPLLCFTLEKDAESPEELNSCEVTLTCIVSGLMFKDKKVLFDKAYHKQGITAVRKLSQLPAKQSLTEQDRYLVMQDTVLNGTEKGKGEGPSVVYFGDFSSVADAKVHLRDLYETSMSFKLKKDFRKFDFALLQYPVRISNEEMANRLQKLPEFKTK